MAKIAFIFVFVLYALQGSNASPLINQPDLFKEGNEVKDLINEINKVLSNISTSESKLRQKLNNIFSEIETAASIPDLVTELQQNITQTLADFGAAADVCANDAWGNFGEITKDISVEHCRSKIDNKTEDFKKKLEKLVSQIRYLLNKISDDVEYCVRMYPTDYEAYLRCVERKVVEAKTTLKVYEKATQDIFNILDAFVPIYTNIMAECVNDKKQKFVNEMIDLIEDLQRCVEN